jgi:hypothetical protein
LGVTINRWPPVPETGQTILNYFCRGEGGRKPTAKAVGYFQKPGRLVTLSTN